MVQDSFPDLITGFLHTKSGDYYDSTRGQFECRLYSEDTKYVAIGYYSTDLPREERLAASQIIWNHAVRELTLNSQDLLRQAYQLAHDESTDTSTKNGALLVNPFDGSILVGGVNSFTGPGMAADPGNYKRPRKYKVTEHAERAVIYKAAQQGIPTKGLIMICPWACCSDCARGIVLAGISLVVAHQQAYDMTPERWREEIAIGMEILRDGGVIYHLYDGTISNSFSVKNLFDGKVWYP